MPYPMETQEMGRWCWAAVALSVEKYFEPTSAMTQCAVATLVRRRQCCPLCPACNVASSLQTALTRVSHFVAPRRGRVPFSVIKAELDAYRPVCVRVAWRTGGAHYLVISGYYFDYAGNPVVELSDPWYNWSAYPFDEFADAYRRIGWWTTTYFVD